MSQTIIVPCDPKVSWMENRNGFWKLADFQVWASTVGDPMGVQISGNGPRRHLRGGLCVDRTCFIKMIHQFVWQVMTEEEKAELREVIDLAADKRGAALL